MSKLEKYFTIFAFGFFVCSACTGIYLKCAPMFALNVVFAAMTWFASIADGGNE